MLITLRQGNSPQTPLPLAGKKVAIDAGHGGNDSGAVGPTKKTEEDATLAMSLELQKLLEAQGAEVRMTRTTDTQVGPPGCDKSTELQSRIDVGNDWPADLFICVHCNSADGPAANGTETYHYREADEGSKRAARDVQSRLISEIGLRNRGVKASGFYVLKHATVPSILVETAFISNPNEEKLLSTADSQKKFAVAMAHGVEDYLLGVDHPAEEPDEEPKHGCFNIFN